MHYQIRVDIIWKAGRGNDRASSIWSQWIHRIVLSVSKSAVIHPHGGMWDSNGPQIRSRRDFLLKQVVQLKYEMLINAAVM